MIVLKHPSLVLHAHDVPGYKYEMHVSWNLPKGASVHDVANWILDAHEYAGDLQNVVLNAHGASGKIWAGGTTRMAIHRYNVDVFRKVNGRIGATIWIIACEVARGDKGTDFCSRLARAAGCNVVASTMEQYVEKPTCPFGCVDDYEPPAFRWDPSGKLSICHSRGAGLPGVVE